MKERDASNVPTVSYTRGTDLSGSLDSSALPGSFDATRGAGSSRQSGATAGGIGGLLARSHGYSSGNWSTHNFYHADGNGSPREIEHEPWQRDPGGGPNLPQPPSNPSLSHGEIITYLVNSSQTVAASYRYDPFGNTLSSSGSLAGDNSYRFSSKEVHANSGMYYYGYRFYDPNVQRWLNRDPIEEAGGINLYGFVGNRGGLFYDPLGLADPGDFSWPRTAKPAPPVVWSGGDNNCLNYAYNLPEGSTTSDGTKVKGNLQPGELHLPRGTSLPAKMDCDELKRRVQADWGNDPRVKPPPKNGNCPDGYHKIHLWLQPDDTFAHATRQDDDGGWSEKPDRSKPSCRCRNPKKPQQRGDQDCGELCVPSVGKL